MKVDEDAAAGDSGDTNNKRKQRSESTSSKSTATNTSTDAESSTSQNDIVVATTTPTTMYDDAGSSRLFQPHRSLGLLTAAYPNTKSSLSTTQQYSPSARLFQSQKGKFHLQTQAISSEETFVTIPLGERFQILTLSKLVPVLVSRALPPSADHHRSLLTGDGKLTAGSNGKKDYQGGDEEEMHQAISDSSLSITVTTHGPKITGKAVSITMYSRTRPLVCLDAFSFLENVNKKKKNQKWGIVDMIPLGKQRVAMSGEKEGKMENTLLFAIVCARDDTVSGGKNASEKGGDGVEVVGDDSEEESESESDADAAAGNNDSTSDDESGDDEDDSSLDSLSDEDKAPATNCYGRILLVQASRTSMKIIKTIDLNGDKGSNFIPYVGLHPATYVNKILLGGRPTEKGSTSMLLVNVRSGKVIHSFQCLSLEDGKKNKSQKPSIITTLAQSPAVDTIAVGTSDGSVHLINTLHDVKLFSLHHKSKAHVKKNMMNNAVSSISFRTDGNATRQGVAPLAVGTDDGSVSVWDLTPVQDDDGNATPHRTLLTQMEGTHHGGISKLSYLPGEPLLLSTGLSSNSILLHVFDAPDHSGRILRQRKGHTSPPQLLRYLHPGVSGGGILANAADGTDASSCQILSCGGAGDLTLRLFSTARSNLDKEYSQGRGLDKKAKKLFGNKEGPEGRAELLLPEIVDLSTSEVRGRDWGDLVTIHRNHAHAYVWSTKRGAQSGPVLRQPHWNISAMKDRPPRTANATSLAISACGSFALVGTVGGVVYKYNIQSGLPRGSFPRDATSATSEEERRRKKGLKTAGDVGRTMRILEKNNSKNGGVTPSDIDQAERDRVSYLEADAKKKAIVGRASHDGAVVGIAIDSLNKTLVTAGADSKLVLWNFVTHMPHKKSPIMLPSPATKLTHVRDSDLAAIAMNDFGVAVFDCSSLTIVRYFGGSRYNKSPDSLGRMSHTCPISDLQFGPDGRKLFTSSLDGTVRVWDVPTGLCVDWMSFSSPPTSLALSPTGEFLATSHVGRLGISLWCDKSFFRMVLLDGTPNEPAKMNEPCPVAECEQEEANDAIVTASVSSILAKKEDMMAFDDTNGEDENDGSPPQAKGEGLITLSGLPPAHWKNLFHLELVKERNKPTEAPQKPPSAPFFLQWRAGLESSGADTAGATDQENAGGTSTTDMTKGKEATTDGWDAVWSDDDADDNAEADSSNGANEIKPSKESTSKPTKRRKVVHHRSKLAELLQSCFDAKEVLSMGETYSDVTSYLSKMGPSSIDVEISSLCYGIHDLEEGLPLLHIASMWLLEACESHSSFEAVNAYLHRFLHVHGNVITRMDQAVQKTETDLTSDEAMEEEDDPQTLKLKEFVETIAQLQKKQKEASNRLQGKMQHSICLLRHLSRMV
eukprot:CAMPEP_0172319220 /NCGR_PEP_ID=MMETSP1058-20130122/37094_1 /TAXON_ID=83371 /ORGANISM="Detonula confervacea, Strain CCMP 353" /LENGTH=1390 /DNA_ID=CAMNT_0013034219 /DNA_START=78 /DNA_END=4250 /DNA_ORIENTATION=-